MRLWGRFAKAGLEGNSLSSYKDANGYVLLLPRKEHVCMLYRQVYFRLRDMVSEPVPATKELNDRIIKGIQLQDLLEKKFPHLETPQAAQASYSGTRATNAGKVAVKAAKVVGVPAALGTAYEPGKCQ